METVVDFIGKMSDLVKNSMDETKNCIGKEVVDTSAGKKGICVDRITDFYGTKISFLGVKYAEDELSSLDRFDQDVLVCQGKDGKFFIRMSEVSAIGPKMILLKSELKMPESEVTASNRENVFKRFYLMREAIKDVLPNSVSESEERESRKWLKKLVGE